MTPREPDRNTPGGVPTRVMTLEDLRPIDRRALRAAARPGATWGAIEQAANAAARQRIGRLGLIEMDPDSSGCVMLTAAGLALVEQLDERG